VIQLVRAYNKTAGEKRIFVVQVTEQEIMDSMMIANRNGNVACTQGGESMAGFSKAIAKGFVRHGETGILDSTAHMLKFITFQDMYFQDTFPPEFGVTPRAELKNAPSLIKPEKLQKFPQPGKPLQGDDMKRFVDETAAEIARILELKKKDK
jgi:threonine synthase